MSEETNYLDTLRDRARQEGGILWLGPDRLGIFEPDAAARANRDNYQDLRIPDPPARVLLGRKGAPPVYWRDIRSAMADIIRELCAPAALAELHERMAREALPNGREQVDLTQWTHRVVSRAQLPNIIATGSVSDLRAVIRDQDMKIRDLVDPDAVDRARFSRTRSLLVQAGAGRAIKRVLRRRLAGREPARRDIAQALLAMHEVLGLDRAAYLVGTFLTAVAGPPGSTAACMLFELMSHPDWRERVECECRAIPLSALCENPQAAAPVTLAFVKESLRRWGFPPVVPRRVDRPLRVGGVELAVGQTYVNSAYVMHRDPASWDDPDSFDPGRWSAAGCPRRAGAYVPFGFGPRSCLGSSLGLAQLILFCHLATTCLRIEPLELSRSGIRLVTAAMPVGFHGVVEARG